MRTIKTLEALSALVRDQHAQGVEVFVRTSTGIANDRRMGCSTNHASGSREAGISVVSLTPHVEVNGIGDHRVLATQVGEWAYVAPVTYLLTGDVVVDVCVRQRSQGDRHELKVARLRNS